MKNIAFGQYYPTNSIIHRMDSRMKIFLSIFFIVAIFFVKSYSGYILTALLLGLIVIIARIPLMTILKSIKGIIFLVFFTAFINLFFYGSTNYNWEYTFWFIRITDTAINFAVFMALRLLFLVMGTSILTLSTTPIELTDGIESLLAPLKIIRFPVHDMALIMSIALRFIPTLMDETEKIILAQKARGADFESGNLIARAKALIPVLIPLFVSAFRRAEELAYAMDSRCYNATKHRTRRKIMKLGYADVIALLTFVLYFTLLLTDNIVFMGLL